MGDKNKYEFVDEIDPLEIYRALNYQPSSSEESSSDSSSSSSSSSSGSSDSDAYQAEPCILKSNN